MTETLTVLYRVEQGVPESEHEDYVEEMATSFPTELLDEHLFHVTCDAVAAYGTAEADDLIEAGIEAAVSNLEPKLDELRDRLTGDESAAELLDDWDFRYACHVISDTACNRYGLYDATDYSSKNPVVTTDTVETIVEDRVGPVYVARLSFDR